MSFGPGDFDLLPPDPVISDPDIALAAALTTDVAVDPVAEEQPLGRGWLFDFGRNQFVRRGSAPAEVSDLDELAMWVNKCLLTDRGAHPIYSDDFGIEDPFQLIGEVATGDALAAYEDAIIEALLVHDRIVAVEEFAFAQDPGDDGLYASFTIILDSLGEANPQSLVFTSVPVVTTP